MTCVLTAYVRERVPFRIYGPAVALHTVAALWATATRPTLSALIQPVGLAVLLLAQFRLWDDLEDRERDRAAHPDRVLVRGPLAPFRLALIALAIGILMLFAVFGPPAATAGVAVLDLAFWLAYGRLRPGVSEKVWRFHVLLVKYPAFVGLLAMTTGTLLPGRLLVAALGTYACACAYEIAHDRHGSLASLATGTHR